MGLPSKENLFNPTKLLTRNKFAEGSPNKLTLQTSSMEEAQYDFRVATVNKEAVENGVLFNRVLGRGWGVS